MRCMISAAAAVLCAVLSASGSTMIASEGTLWLTRYAAAHPALGILRVAAGPASGQDPRRLPLAEEVQGVVQARLENRRRPPSVLGGPQNHDHVRGPRLVDR